jgi:hypothetical protein
MNDPDKQKLIAEIVSDPKNFEISLHDRGRIWFVDQLIRTLESTRPPTPDAQIPARVRDVVAKTKELAKAKEEIVLKIPLKTSHPGWWGNTRPRRIEVIYGVIATDPTLLERSAEKHLDLAIRRRYRSIARMELWVNGGSLLPLFQYPNDLCPTLKINEAAVPLWNVATPHTFPNGDTLPRWTIKTAPASVVPALEQLWTDAAAVCGGNVLECATALSTVLMDSLLETKNPNTFLRAVRARAPLHLAICNPTHDAPNFVQDDHSSRVFTTIHGSIGDLQIGDYVYVLNHPVYSVFYRAGSWSGEHAVVSACRNRDPLKGFEITGHGLPPKQIHDVHQHLLKFLQTFMDRLYVIVAAFFEYINAPAPGPNVIFQEEDVVIGGRPYKRYFYLFNRSFTHRNYETTPITNRDETGYLIVYTPGRGKMGVHRSKNMATARQNPDDVFPLELMGSALGPEEPINWGIPFKPPSTPPGSLDWWPLFRRDNGKLTLNLIGPKDMPDPPLDRNFDETGVRRIGPYNRPTPAGAV